MYALMLSYNSLSITISAHIEHRIRGWRHRGAGINDSLSPRYTQTLRPIEKATRAYRGARAVAEFSEGLKLVVTCRS